MKVLSWAKGAPAAVPVEHTAVCLRRERSWSALAGLLPRVRGLSLRNASYIPLTAHLLFFVCVCSLHALPRACSPCNSHSFLIYRLPSPSPSMFLHTGKINHLIGTPSAEISCSRGRRFGALVMKGRGEDEPAADMQL